MQGTTAWDPRVVLRSCGGFLFEVGGVKYTLPVGEVSGHQGYSACQGEHEYNRGQGNF